MPKFEPKQMQQELAAKRIWTVNWLVGTELMKARELAKRIQKALHGEQKSSFLETHLDGESCSAAEILDAAQSVPLGGGTPIVFVKRAEKLKDPEALEVLAEKPSATPPFVVVLFASALDGRKKSTKTIVNSFAVVNCEAVAEAERGAWVNYLAKARGMQLPTEVSHALAALDPWTLDRVDLELARLALLPPDSISVEALYAADPHRLIQALLHGDRSGAEREIATLDTSTDSTLQTLGLLSWHLRQLTLKPSGRWTLESLEAAGREVQEFDRAVKQTSKLPRALWSTLSEHLSEL